MEHLGRILILEPDPIAAHVVRAECARVRRASVLGTAAETARALESAPRLTAFVTEEALPDGSGLEVLRELRASYPLVPALLLTAETTAAVINRAHLLGAEFVAKPARRRNLAVFLRRAVAFERVSDRRVTLVVDELVRARGLSPRETDVLAAAVQGVPRRTIADQLGTTENTVKSCVKSLLRKCDAADLEAVVREVFRVALAGSEAGSDGARDRDSTPPGRPFTIPPPVAPGAPEGPRA